ncbi:MAG: DNA polymerase III subunit beta [Syntrophomonadaceae bacterium]|jgi:DNA polymerase-3 subunit beta|nr:DNA polymerase III subunit beta [Syntrophomonadaceae bacterium]
MKFIIEKKELSSLSSLVYRAASSKNTIPILSGMLIQVNPTQGLTLTATDMDIGIVASTQEVEVLTDGQVLVNAHYFNDFIKLLPDGIITIELNQEASKLSINYGRSSGFINIYRDFEYPNLPLEKMEKRMELPQSILREALRKTSFAAAFNHFRPVFTGVLFDFLADHQLRIVASDTHRLAYYAYELKEEQDREPFNFIIPIRTVNELMRVLNEEEENINISFGENNVIFHKENFTLLSRLIEGSYPNYRQVIPLNSSSQVLINSNAILNALERAKTMPTDDKLKIQNVQFKFKENEVLINAFSEIMGELEEFIEEIQIDGEKEVNIAFNTNYFLDIAKIMQAECQNMQIDLSGSIGPAIIKNPEKDNYLYVLVPLRSSN